MMLYFVAKLIMWLFYNRSQEFRAGVVHWQHYKWQNKKWSKE